jgi:hypothetical protein
MSKNKINRVCIFCSIYSLLIYLLYSNEDELEHTYFFFSDDIPESIRKKIPNQYFVNISSKYFFDAANKKMLVNIIKYIFLAFSFCIFRYIKWPFIKKAEIYGNDHIFYFPFIIGKHNYTFIEEVPKIITFNLKKIYSHRLIKGIIKKILCTFISDVIGNYTANNKQCKALILTENDSASYIEGKTKYLIPLDITWKNIKPEKKQYILNVFDISDNDISVLKSKTNIILTQPLSGDRFTSEEEQINIYSQIIRNYDPSSLIIKAHPRDTVNYRKYFPDVFVFNKPIPMQLLLLIDGLKIKKAITIFSTSIMSFPDSVEKEWIGTSVHPALLKQYPNFVNNPYIS